MPTKLTSRSIKKPTAKKSNTRIKPLAPEPTVNLLETTPAEQPATVLPISTPLPAELNRAWWWLDRVIITLTILLVLSGLIILGKWWQASQQSSKLTYNFKNTDTSPVAQLSLLTAVAPLTGLPATPTDAGRRPWAVVIENFPSVRPQFGLASADLVFESPTEGGITRFLAIFQSQLPTDQLGPIRSARPYFNDWARTFSALFSHSGGTAEALQQLKGGYGGLQDVNEFFNQYAYQRDDTKKAPHNLFTTAERFWNYVQGKGWDTTVTTAPWFSFNDQIAEGEPATSINLPYYPTDYSVRYDYQSDKAVYQRSLNNTVQTDALTQEPIGIKNVIVLLTDVTPIPNDPLLKVNIRTIGSGKIILFTRGQQYTGRWQKTGLDAPLKFLTPQGTTLQLTPGKTWISVMDSLAEKDIKIEPVATNP